MTVPFQRLYSKKFTIIFLIVTIYFLMVLILAGNLYGTHVEPLDLQFAYTPEKAYQIIDTYTPLTRRFYILCEFTLDVVYPIAYTIFFSFSLLALYPNRKKLALLPYVVFTLDMCENLGIITMLSLYPVKVNAIAWMTSAFTTAKWLVSLVCVAIVFNSLFLKLYKFISAKK